LNSSQSAKLTARVQRLQNDFRAAKQPFFRYRGCISQELEKQNHTAKADISTLPGSGHLNFALTFHCMRWLDRIQPSFRYRSYVNGKPKY
jgi:hypothetical protein